MPRGAGACAKAKPGPNAHASTKTTADTSSGRCLWRMVDKHLHYLTRHLGSGQYFWYTDSMSVPERDWTAVLQRIVDGDRLALVQASRLVNGFLVYWNAYAFRNEWEDLVQEVILAAALALREGRVRDRQAVVGFLLTTTRFKYLDRLRIQLGRRRGERLPGDELLANLEHPLEERLGPEAREDLRRALARIPERKREAVLAVYVGGMTYDEAARVTGIPLGTFKRYLRDGLAQLRNELAGVLDR